MTSAGSARPTCGWSVYADTDEANAAIGVVTVGGLDERVVDPLRQIQNDCLTSARTCAPIVPEPEYPPAAGHRGLRHPPRGGCDEFNPELKLNSFILPGGTPGAGVPARRPTVTRRAERSVGAAGGRPERTNPLTARYLNRLSDLLFILGRVANPQGDVLRAAAGGPHGARPGSA
ncbi:ATP:cob(I)alamin adenosyltransferase [Pseudonocardia sp. MCCB 268]|nr:ATP:cob(I)alamin adenosyltransferase [Pseudonocardia cytotoxica]